MQLNQHNNPLYVLSAMNSYRSREANHIRHTHLMQHLKAQRVPFTEVEGSYNGIPERSVILIGSHQMTAHHYSSVYQQESFLRLEPVRDNGYKASFIITASGAVEPAGYFISVPLDKIRAEGLDYTKDSAGNYFTIIPASEYKQPFKAGAL